MTRLPLWMLLVVLAVLVGRVLLPAGHRSAAERAQSTREAFEQRAEAAAEQGERYADEALRFRHAQLEDDDGEIPADAVVKAAEAGKRLQRSPSSTGDVAGIARGAWTSLGPGNVGGRTRSIVIHPTNPQTMWAGSVSGGIWKTTDGGASWRALDDFIANLRVATMVIDRRDPNVLYAGTGESFTSHLSDAISGAGVFKTTDGGTTWNQLATTSGSAFSFVNRLAMDPEDSGVLLAATNSGIWRTTDGGATAWTQTATTRALDIDFHPTDGNLAVAGGSGIAWYTTNAGASWTAATGLPPSARRIELAYARSSPTTVYASVNNAGGEIYKSTDSGRSYVRVNTGASYLSGQGEYDNAIWVSPTDASKVVVGGIDLWRSADGGASLTKISDWASEQKLGNSVHADNHVLVESPQYNGTSNRTVLVGDDGGVYRAADIDAVGQTSGWQELNNRYGVTQFYSGAAGAGGRIVGGTQDNGTPVYQGGTETWGSIFGGDGGYVAADPTNASYFYGEYVYLRIFRNTNGATSTQGSDYIHGGDFGGCTKPAPYRIPDACSPPAANFIAPFVLDPSNPNRILAGGASLWRTNDARTANTASSGPQWAQIKAPVSAGDYISAIAIAPGNPDLVWVGHNNGEIFKSSDATAAVPTWTRVDDPVQPKRRVLRLTVDPRDPSQVYAGFSGYAPRNLWRTTDGGTSWSVRTGTGAGTLPDAPVRSVVVNPTDSDRIYAGTEVGVFASEDRGATWGVPHDGPANVPADELFWSGSTLVAATHGRGMFSTPVDVVSPVNDDFGAPQVLSGTAAARTGDTNVAGTKQTGEPDHAGNPGGASVWYRWTPAAGGPVTIDTRQSAFDTTLGVYTGSAVDALQPVAANDDETPGAVTTSRVTFTATAGTTYRIAVDGHATAPAPAATGSVKLHLEQTVPVLNPLTVTRTGAGSGTVTSSPAGVDCGADCAESYPAQTEVTLTATPAAGSTFAGWSGDCTGAQATCLLTMSGNRAATATFADSAPPTNPTLASPSHATGVWSPDTTVDASWSGAADAGGVDGFSYAWDTSPATVPDTVKDAEETADAATSPPLGDGDSHWFHLRTRDNAGNWSAPVGLGPFFIDATPPLTGPLSSLTHLPGVPSTDPTVDVTWPSASDAASGLSAFSFAWDDSATTQPDTEPDASAAVTSATSPRLAPGDHFFHLRARDAAGNWSAATHAGPFSVAPLTPIDIRAPALALGGRRRQRVLRQGTVTVAARSGEAAAVVASGRVALRGVVVRPRRTSRRVAAGATTTFELRLSRSGLVPIRRALVRGRRVDAALTVTATDAAGNTATVRRVVRLVR